MGTSVPDDNVAWDEEVAKVVDDSPGHLLDPNLMAKARQEELEWLRKEKVYERVPATGCQGKPLQLKWVDVSEGDHTAPKIRSHLVAKEIKRAKPLADQLGGADTFAATPPLESVYALMSSFMTRQQRGEACKMMTAWNVSSAHFTGKRSMYGTQDASQILLPEGLPVLVSQSRCRLQCTMSSRLSIQMSYGTGAW